jgi:cell division protein FtsB
MIVKFFKLSFLFLLIFLALVQNPARAGVMTKMVEVDSECSRELDVMRVELDETKASNISLSERINKLLNDNIVLTSENKALKEKNAVLSSQIAGLKQTNSELAVKIEELKNQVESQSLAQNQIIQNPPSISEDEEVELVSQKHFSNYLWPFVAVPIGAIAGTLRGASFKSIEYSDNASVKMPDTIPTTFVAKIGGLVLGTLTGAVTGFIKGVVNGVNYGFTDPLSTKSISLDGDFASDWDPYKI